MTTKQIMFIVLSVLLVLVVIAMSMVLTRVSDLLFMAIGPGTSPSVPSSSSVPSDPSGSSEPSYSIPSAPSIPSSEPSSEPSAPSSVPSSEPSTPGGHEHEFVLVHTVPATCETSGYSVYECNCGKEDTRDLTDPLTHDYVETVIAATCETDGYTLNTCQRCQEEKRFDEVSAPGHSYGDWEIAQPPVGDPLTQMQRTCANCGDVQLQDQPEPPTEPSDPEIPTEPTEPELPEEPTEPTEPEIP